MLPRKEHLKQINRLHNTYFKLEKQISECGEKDKEKSYRLLKKLLKLQEIWNEVDDFIDYKLKIKLDELK